MTSRAGGHDPSRAEGPSRRGRRKETWFGLHVSQAGRAEFDPETIWEEEEKADMATRKTRVKLLEKQHD